MVSTLLAATIVFFFGATLGSFLHVVALRLPAGRSFAGRARSACPHCHATLTWVQLIPLISYAIQRGRCRACGQAISARYPAVEVLTGLLLLALLWPYLTGLAVVTTPVILLKLILEITILTLLSILFIIDADTFILPDPLILLLLAATLLHQGLLGHLSQPAPYLGILIGSGFLGLLYLATKGQGLGLGDVKLMIPLGLLFGPTATTVLLFLAFGSGALVAVYLLVAKKATSKTAIPFGPYLCGAAILLLLFPQLTDHFTNFLGY